MILARLAIAIGIGFEIKRLDAKGITKPISIPIPIAIPINSDSDPD